MCINRHHSDAAARPATTRRQRRASATKWQRLRHVGAIRASRMACPHDTHTHTRIGANRSPRSQSSVSRRSRRAAEQPVGLVGWLLKQFAYREHVSCVCVCAETRHCSSRECVWVCTAEITSTRVVCVQEQDVVAYVSVCVSVFGVSHMAYVTVAERIYIRKALTYCGLRPQRSSRIRNNCSHQTTRS